ncbi:epidermal growth factor-like protein 7 isoform X6 [Eptesicus fuscus]|uniref:epidermal growth factor-like protein 7 isoform X6 n=1 Tax=Eptesicus fuscus TaxID=29078 RepID=UPI002403AE60|nr:epidermal growth factor-like protein 7 isoform X6 [Eptesicus fuscus]
MGGCRELLLLWALVLAAGGTELVYRPGTIYKTAYRRSPGPAPARPRYACCPGWKRTRGLPGACGAAICQPPCQNGGSCVRPGRGHCPAGWQGGSSQTGAHGEVQEEVQRLRTRVDVLEQKLQLVLEPLHSLASRALDQGLRDPGRFLAHSFQQLDRIDSLSEQVSFLEEQLGSCSCKKEL